MRKSHHYSFVDQPLVFVRE